MSAGLESPFECLFDDTADTGLSLPEHLRATYDGDWVIPVADDRTYSYSNFVVSHDGRISFNEPGHYGGGDVSGGNAHDTWLMAMLRARADAIMVGDNTLRLEPEHFWTHEFIFPPTSGLFDELRRAEGRSQYPLQVFLSIDGNINWDADLMAAADHHVIIATTTAGAARIASEQQAAARVDVIAQDRKVVDLRELVSELRSSFGVGTLLIEGGPTAYGSAIANGIIDDEFLTLSPIIIGNDRARDKVRPGLYEGLAFSPDNAARMIPVSLRRNGDFLFVRSRCRYPDRS